MFYHQLYAMQVPVGAVDLRQQPAMRLTTSAAQSAPTPATEGQDGPAKDTVSATEEAEPSGSRTSNEMDVGGDKPGFNKSVEQAGAPAVGKYRWKTERTEREIRRAKFARDEVSSVIELSSVIAYIMVHVLREPMLSR